MKTFSNIQAAIESNLCFHVITKNEVHSFLHSTDAIEDAANVPDKNDLVEIISQADAIEKYLPA